MMPEFVRSRVLEGRPRPAAPAVPCHSPLPPYRVMRTAVCELARRVVLRLRRTVDLWLLRTLRLVWASAIAGELPATIAIIRTAETARVEMRAIVVRDVLLATFKRTSKIGCITGGDPGGRDEDRTHARQDSDGSQRG